MSGYDHDMSGGLVVGSDYSDGYSGGYSGGSEPFEGLKTYLKVNDGMFSLMIALTLVLIVVVVVQNRKMITGFENTSGANVRFVGESSQPSLEHFAQSDRGNEFLHDKLSSFTGSREPPYFSDVTNRVLRMEDREKEAIRALGKINQERIRRRPSGDPMSSRPLPWAPFWKEWQQTHGVEDGLDGEGFQESSNLMEHASLPY